MAEVFLFHSKSSKVDESRLKNQVILLSMKINDENNYIWFRKLMFSDILEGITVNIFQGASPQPVSF